MTRIGQFNKKITHTSRVVDAGNNKDLRGIFGEIDPTDSATTNKTYWAFVEPLASKEVVKNDKVYSINRNRFTIRANKTTSPQINVTDEITDDNNFIYNIIQVIYPQNRENQIVCVGEQING